LFVVIIARVTNLKTVNKKLKRNQKNNMINNNWFLGFCKVTLLKLMNLCENKQPVEYHESRETGKKWRRGSSKSFCAVYPSTTTTTMVFQKLSIVFKVNFFRFSHELDTKESSEEGGGYKTIKEIL